MCEKMDFEIRILCVHNDFITRECYYNNVIMEEKVTNTTRENECEKKSYDGWQKGKFHAENSPF